LSGTTEGFSKIARPGWASTSQPNTKNLSLLLPCASIDREIGRRGSCLVCGRWTCELLFEKFERAVSFAASEFSSESDVSLPNGCIRESFVGNYRVNHDAGLHIPVRTRWTLGASPFGCAHRKSAKLTWPRFFTAVRISSQRSVSFLARCLRPWPLAE